MINKYLCRKVIWSSLPLSFFLPSHLTLYKKFKKKRELGAGEGDRKEGGNSKGGRERRKQGGRGGRKEEYQKEFTGCKYNH